MGLPEEHLCYKCGLPCDCGNDSNCEKCGSCIEDDEIEPDDEDPEGD